MQHFTIRDIENLTGIKAHTLRIWEQRYHFFKPKRKESQHRFYDNDDLKRLLRIAYLYHNGFKVSRIDTLTEEEILNELSKDTVASGVNANYIVRLIEAAIDFNEYVFVQQLNAIINTIGFEKTIVDVCYPFLVRVGLLWSTNHIIPAQEHFSSYLIQRRIISETDRLVTKPEKGKTIVLFTPEGEHHEMPLLFINYLFKKKGWETVYLGAGKKIDLLKTIVETRKATHIYLHLLTNLSGLEVNDLMELVCNQFTAQKIIASGTAIHSVQRSFVNLTCLKTDEEIKRFIGIVI